MKKIKVCFGQLTKKLEETEINEGTTLGQFVKANDIVGKPRVNGETVNKDYVLKDKDIITQIDRIRGGSV